jgi:hypothetical protein
LHCCVPHLHPFTSCVRQGYYIHNTASFRCTPQALFHCIPAVSCLSPFTFSAVAPSHSHRGWRRSVKTSLCPKSRNAFGCLMFFPRRFTLFLLHFASRTSPAAILGFRWLFDCRNPATALLVLSEKDKTAVLGGV